MKNPLLLTIFGGTGDLTFRKLLPALYSMEVSGKLERDAEILIVGRRDYTDALYREKATPWIKEYARLPFSQETIDCFLRKIHYFQMDFSVPQSFDALGRHFSGSASKEHIFYLAVAPRFFSVIADGLGRIRGAGKGKLVLEKPFGENLEDAVLLNRRLTEVFSEDQIYRIDHYLGKEMVRGIAAIRFTNPIFNYVWDARQIEYVEISAMEQVGVETRGGYYDSTGALRDMVQNHLFQILTILAMERPAQFYGSEMHEEQLKVLKALRMPERGTVQEILTLGQYEGYQGEPSVASGSQTETFAALCVYVDNDRWRNMPFYIRTGKKTGRREMKVTVAFRRIAPGLPRNLLSIYIQPSEGVYLQFNMKQPGETDEIKEARMDFCQSCTEESQANTPEAYERLLTSCIQGEKYWFSRWDQIEAGWRYVDQLKKLIEEEPLPVYTYQPGTEGPKEVGELS